MSDEELREHFVHWSAEALVHMVTMQRHKDAFVQARNERDEALGEIVPYRDELIELFTPAQQEELAIEAARRKGFDWNDRAFEPLRVALGDNKAQPVRERLREQRDNAGLN